MPLKGFICPDGQTIEKSECLKKCRMDERCSSPNYLSMAGNDRPWTGTLSASMFSKGAREIFLEIKKDYYISPEDRTFMVLGIGSHVSIEDDLSRMEFMGISGLPDEIYENEDGTLTIVDHKVVGSYKVAKMIGVDYREEMGTKRGKPAMVKVFFTDPSLAENQEYTVQLNLYRKMIEKSTGKKVSKLFNQIIVRDGGLEVANKRGVSKNKYYLPVKILNDEDFLPDVIKKKAEVIEAIETDTMPPMCSASENWEGRKCKGYCNVAQYCTGNPVLEG